MRDFLSGQHHDVLYRGYQAELKETGSSYLVSKQGIPSRRSGLDGAIRQAIQTKLHPAILYSAYCPTLAWNMGGRRMYNTVRQRHYWTHVARDVYNYIGRSQYCRWPLWLSTHQSLLKQLLLIFHFVFMAVDVLGSVSKTRSDNGLVLLIIYHFSKLIKAIKVKKETVIRVFEMFPNA